MPGAEKKSAPGIFLRHALSWFSSTPCNKKKTKARGSDQGAYDQSNMGGIMLTMPRNAFLQKVTTAFLTSLSLLLFIIPSQAQRSDFDHPIDVDSSELRGTLNGNDDERFYSLTLGAGETRVTFEVQAAGTNAGATFDLFDRNHRTILSNVLLQGINRGSDRVTEKVRLGRAQEVVLRVKGIRYGSEGGQGTFLVRVDEAESLRHSTELPIRQSRSDWDHPVPFSSNELEDGLDGNDDEQFFVFTANPGTLQLIFEVQASGDNAGATFDLFDVRHRPILSNVLVQSIHRSTEREVKTIKLGREQKVILRVKGIRYGSAGGQGIYRVRLSN